MTVEHSKEFFICFLSELRKLPRETEWLEFKYQNDTLDCASKKYKNDKIVKSFICLEQ